MTAADPHDGVPEEIRLEPLRIDHAAEMVAVLSDPALYEFTGGEPPSRDSLTARYRAQVAGSGDPEETWRNWVIRLTDGGEAIGFVQATVVGDTADVAWLIGVQHQGRGFASRAVRAMVDRLIDAGVQRIDAHIHRQHRSSQRVASSIGLERSGDVDDEGEEIWSRSVSA